VPIDGEYAPSAAQWVRDQVDQYERSQGQQANTLRETGLPIVVVTMQSNPDEVTIQDGAEPFNARVRQIPVFVASSVE
jgi:hypothetical protein